MTVGIPPSPPSSAPPQSPGTHSLHLLSWIMWWQLSWKTDGERERVFYSPSLSPYHSGRILYDDAEFVCVCVSSPFRVFNQCPGCDHNSYLWFSSIVFVFFLLPDLPLLVCFLMPFPGKDFERAVSRILFSLYRWCECRFLYGLSTCCSTSATGSTRTCSTRLLTLVLLITWILSETFA